MVANLRGRGPGSKNRLGLEDVSKQLSEDRD
jgi:hypothetical protein